MNDPDEQNGKPGDPFSAWLRATGDFFTTFLKASTPVDGDAPGSEEPSRWHQSWKSGWKLWQAALSAAGKPEGMEMLVNAFRTAPEISLRFMQTAASGALQLQQRWMQRFEKLSASPEAYSFKDLDKEFLNRWTDLYTQEFQKFLNIPQIGLTRFYQENYNRAVDKYNLLQAAVIEFVHLLLVPMEKSFQVMEEKLVEMTDAGQLTEDAGHYYGMWIKILEGHYMTLFQSPEYTATLGKTVDALNGYIAARREVFEDLAKCLAIPTQRDLDELYKEIYQYKKRLRRLEKRVDAGSEDKHRPC